MERNILSNWNYTVTHYNITTAATTDITSLVMALPLFTDQGNDEINSAEITFSTPLGEFIKTAPLIKQFDRIEIKSLDGFQGKTYNKVFDVKRITPTRTKSGGTKVTLNLAGMEQHLQKINYSGTGYFTGAAETLQEIGDNYNDNKKSRQPTLTGHKVSDSTNELPNADFQNNIYEYGLNEDQGHNRIIETSDKQGASVDDGGSLDFYDIKIDSTSYTDISIKAFSSGKNGSVILSDSNQVNQGETEGGIDALTGTLICAWGGVDQGSLPIDHSRFKSREQRFPLIPYWSTAQKYSRNSRVQYLGIHYKSLQNNNESQTPPQSSLFWQIETEADYYGNVIQYSPYTVGKANLWKNSGSGLVSSPLLGAGCWDGNLVIQDNQQGSFQSWVDLRVTNPENIPSNFLYSGASNLYYRGLRVLVQGTGTGDFSGNDSNGKPYTNSIVYYTGVEWLVLYEAISGLLCSSINDGLVYEFTNSTWSYRNEDNANNAFHPYDSIVNVPGILALNNGSTDTTFTVNQNSAIRARYDFTPISILTPRLATYYKVGAWLNFRFPFPHNTVNSISEKVGELYGGKYQVNNTPDVDREPVTLDAQNMKYTHNGFRGFTHGLDSEVFGPISALEFWMKIDSQGSLSVVQYTSSFTANFKMRCLIYDTNDNVVFQDFILPFNDTWEPVKLSLSGFSIYRARKSLSNFASSIIPPKELESLGIFEWKNIKQITFQTQESYDDEGRYNPISSRYINDVAEPRPLRRIDLYIDAFRFTKPLLVNTGTPTGRSIEPDFLQKPDIGNYDQLKSDALAELEKTRFQHVEYVITTNGKYDIEFGDSFWFRHDKLIPVEFQSTDSPDGDNTNTIKLVAKKIEYSITDAVDGKGGFLRTIQGVRRFI